MVKVDPGTKRYSLDVGVLALAHSVVQNNPFTTLVQPVLDRLSESWNVTTIGIKVTGVEDLVVLALARSRAPFRLYVEVGSRFPALTSATGRLPLTRKVVPGVICSERMGTTTRSGPFCCVCTTSGGPGRPHQPLLLSVPVLSVTVPQSSRMSRRALAVLSEGAFTLTLSGWKVMNCPTQLPFWQVSLEPHTSLQLLQ